MFFNTRVLEVANDKNVPLLERVKFLSISASNLDEFFMVRVAGLRTQVLAGVTQTSFDGLTPRRQLKKINKRVRKITKAQQKTWQNQVKELADENVHVLQPNDLSKAELSRLTALYKTQIRPLLSPLAVDPAHPFPFIPNLGQGLVLRLKRQKDQDPLYALIPVPSQVPRFLWLEGAGSKALTLVLIEDVLHHFAAEFFPGLSPDGRGTFRIIRDSDIAIDEGAEDLVQHFEFLIKQRRRGRVIRLEMDAQMPEDLKHFLIENFECWDEDIHEIEGMMSLQNLAEIAKFHRPELKYTAFNARFPERIREFNGDCFSAIAAKDIVVHHPYEDFDVVVQFLEQAANDPDVVAIKQTLYRTSDDSPIVRALIKAAEKGKNVTALVELKARFDEESNLRWARDLERAGAHVVYGFIDYKTHAKVSLVVRREGSGLKIYTHLGTGNYHAQNAKIYTDLALFTADQEMGEDVGKLFNYVTSYSPPENLKKLVIAPLQLRGVLTQYIKEEMAFAKQGKPAMIWAKMNALVDGDIIDKLYAASKAGVQIDLIVRGICCLRPGVPGLSDNIRVKSIVGRYLEHSRIVCFGNGQALPHSQAKVFFSSADWMPRNLNRRVETLVPVEDKTVKRQILNQIMVANLMDNQNSWYLKVSGKYVKPVLDPEEKVFSAHEYFMRNPSLSGRGRSLKYSAPRDLTERLKKKRPKH